MSVLVVVAAVAVAVEVVAVVAVNDRKLVLFPLASKTLTLSNAM